MLGQITMLQAVDIGKIKMVTIEFDPKKDRIKKVTGPNGSGKSTVLNTIRYALEGKKSIPNDVVRHGYYSEGDKAGKEIDKGIIRIETENGYMIERSIRKNDKGEQVESLKVMKIGEGEVKSAQTFINSMLSQYRNPQKIADMSSKDLFFLLIDSIKDQLADYDKRIQDIKASAAETRTLIKRVGVPVEPEVPEPSETGDYAEEMMRLNEISQKASEAIYQETMYRNEVDRARSKVYELEEELKAERKKLENAEVSLVKANEAAAALTRARDEKYVKVEQLRGCEEASAIWKKFKADVQELESLQVNLQEYVEDAKKVEEQKRLAITGMDLPISNLEVDADNQEVKYDGILWDNLEESTRLLKGLEMCIKTTPEEAPRIFTMARGESIGKERQELIAKMLYENDAFLIMEVMQDGPSDGFVVIEGTDEIIFQKEEEEESDEKRVPDFTGSLF